MMDQVQFINLLNFKYIVMMKYSNLVFLLCVMIATSCHKPDESCSEFTKSTIACWQERQDSYFIFDNENIDFYCLNGPVAVGFAKEKSSDQSDLLKLLGYPYFLDKKGENFNQQFGSYTGGSEKGVFDAYCYDTRKDKNSFNTYVVVENYDKITKDTKEIYCRLEYRKYQWDIERYYTVVDSMRTTFKRVN